MRIVSLIGFLLVFWLALSGHYTPWLIGAGVASALLCAYVAQRVRIVDPEGQPYELLRGALTYWPWLVREIIKSAWGVTRIVLDPRLPISPTMTVVKASQKSTLGIATYANSITLTPGTLTVGVKGDRLMVHALTSEGALDIEAGSMDRRVTEFEAS
jgi:multicomponent Na+:H+ antiporter subunit E